jgi:predicted RNase H-like nuclease (RuvC/YqgF family)
MSDVFWQALRAEMRAEIVDLRDRLAQADEEVWRLNTELGERDDTIAELRDELAESKRRHPSNGRQ